jgi:hypothetical protein
VGLLRKRDGCAITFELQVARLKVQAAWEVRSNSTESPQGLVRISASSLLVADMTEPGLQGKYIQGHLRQCLRTCVGLWIAKC